MGANNRLPTIDVGVTLHPEIGWGLSPEKAKKFKTLKKANSVISDLDIGDKSEAAPAFDLGKTIVVLAERPKNGPSVNPLRTVFD